MRSSEYWQQRFVQLEEQLSKQGLEYYRELEKEYRKAAKSLEADIDYWYNKFAKNNDMNYVEAKKLLNFGDLEEFQWTVEEYIKYGELNNLDGEYIKQLVNASSRVHVTRLTALQTSMRQRAEVLAASLESGLAALGSAIYSEAYLKAAYEIQLGLNIGWQVGIDENRARKILSKPWTADEKTFSDRIWANKQSLIGTLETELTQAIIRGDPPDKVIDTVSKRLDVNKNQAARLVMTESGFFSSAALGNCFTDLGVEKYRVVATLDLKTSPVCQGMDGKVFDAKDFEPGVTAHPFHPWCRTTECPHIEGAKSVRAARDPETGKTEYVPDDMTYPEWYQKYVVERHGEEKAKLLQKMSDNETADRNQYLQYKETYGKDMPKTFEEFQEMKYTDTERWDRLKAQANSKNYLQNQLAYTTSSGEKSFIPKSTKFEKVVTIAGTGSDTDIKDVNRIISTHGGDAADWSKKAGKISSDAYVFDVHWYEKDGIQYEVKMKNRTEKKR